MNYKLLFPTQYLCAADLRGKDAHLTIRRLVVEEIKSEQADEKKPVLYFEETHAKAPGNKEKRLILNVTNAKTIAKLHGSETDAWTGKRITLFATTCQAFGEEKDCIRIRPVAPPASEPEPKADKTTGEIKPTASSGSASAAGSGSGSASKANTLAEVMQEAK